MFLINILMNIEALRVRLIILGEIFGNCLILIVYLIENTFIVIKLYIFIIEIDRN